MSNHTKYKDKLSSCGIYSVTDAENQSQLDAKYAVEQILPLINEESKQISSILNRLPQQFKNNILTFGIEKLIEKLTAMANLKKVSEFLTEFKTYSTVLKPLLRQLVIQKNGDAKTIYTMVITVVEIAANVRMPVHKPIEMD